jgi:hypothetical protein
VDSFFCLVPDRFARGRGDEKESGEENRTGAAESATVADVKIESATALSLPPAEVTVGGLFRDAEAQGIGDILVPVWQHDTGLLFVNPRASRTDHSEEEYNLGLGYRQLFPKGPFIVGANVFYDYRDTGHSSYNQFRLGLEFMSPWVDARANYYRPENKETTVANASNRAWPNPHTQSGWTDPYATDHEMLNPTSRNKSPRPSPPPFSMSNMNGRWKDIRRGGCSASVADPSGIDRCRVFGGYYCSTRTMGRYQGIQGRLEVRLLSSFFFDARCMKKGFDRKRLLCRRAVQPAVRPGGFGQGEDPFAEMDSRFKREARPSTPG